MLENKTLLGNWSHQTPLLFCCRAISYRRGESYVAGDDAPWVWADASGEPVILNGLPPGPHKILIQLVNANHQPIDQGTVPFTMAAAKPRPEAY
jgi:hypothetical protein